MFPCLRAYTYVDALLARQSSRPAVVGEERDYGAARAQRHGRGWRERSVDGTQHPLRRRLGKSEPLYCVGRSADKYIARM